LRTDEGGIWDLHAIIRFLARVTVHYPLYGQNFYEASLIDTWMDWARTDIESHAEHIYPASKLEGMDPVSIHEVWERVKTSFDALNKHLLNNTFLATRRISIADITVVFSIIPLVAEYCDPGFRKQNSNVFRWFDTVVNHPAFVEVVGPVVYCAKNPMPPLPKAPAKKNNKKKRGRWR